jgi:hypothetical protein
MAIKTFTTGEVLTASDTNTYLANAGWVYVNSGTFAGSSSVVVSNVFTSAYTNYKIVLQDLLFDSSNGSLSMLLTVGGTPSTTQYYSGSQYWTFGASPSSANFGDNNSGSFGGMFIDNTTRSSAEWTFYNPAVAVTTSQTYNTVANNNSLRMGGGYHNVATAYDGFNLLPGSPRTVSGTWSVYGQRKA